MKQVFKLLFFVICLIGVSGLIGFGGYVYCQYHPSYLLDSTCFNVDYRCGGECLQQEGNYTGVVKDKCLCDCGEFYVSYCSGFKYEKI
jgi:hypothetical protein